MEAKFVHREGIWEHFLPQTCIRKDKLFIINTLQLPRSNNRAFSGCADGAIQAKGTVKIGSGKIGNLLKRPAVLLELIL